MNFSDISDEELSSCVSENLDNMDDQSSVTDLGSSGPVLVTTPPLTPVSAAAATTVAAATAVAYATTTTTAATASGPNCATIGPSISQAGPSSVPAFSTGLPPSSTAAGTFGSGLRTQDCLYPGFPQPSYPAPTDLGWPPASTSTTSMGNPTPGSFHNMNFGGPPAATLPMAHPQMPASTLPAFQPWTFSPTTMQPYRFPTPMVPWGMMTSYSPWSSFMPPVVSFMQYANMCLHFLKALWLFGY